MTALGMAFALALPAIADPGATAASASAASVSQSGPASCGTPPTPGSEPLLLPAWSDASGWTDPGRYETIVSGDVNGDGRFELMGRNGAYVEVYEWAPPFETGDPDPGQWLMVGPGPALSDGDGWDEAPYFTTIQTADLDGDGDDELLARDSAGIIAFDFSGADLGTGSWSPLPMGPAWSDKAGWNQVPQYSTIQVGDLNGDGSDDVMGLDPNNSEIVAATYSSGTAAWQELPALGIGTGWENPEFYPSIQTADLDGDGTDEVVARSGGGIVAFQLAAGAWTELPPGPPWSNASGWGEPEQALTIQTADVDGDGSAELLGVSDTALEVYSYDAGVWNIVGSNEVPFPQNPWNAPQYYLTIQTGDVDGDGAAEVLARGPDGLVTYELESNAWTSVGPTFGALSDAIGWDKAPYYSTIAAVPVLTSQPEVLIGRSNMGIDTWTISGVAPDGSWVSASSPFPEWVQTPIDDDDPLQRAYQYIDDAVGEVLWPTNTIAGGHWVPILTQLQDTTQNATSVQTELAQVKPRGLNVTRSEWDTVDSEMTAWVVGVVDLASYFYGTGEGASVQSLAADQLMLTSVILQQIDATYFNVSSTEEILAIVSTVLASMAAAASAVIDPAELPLLVIGMSLLASGLSSWQGFVNPEGQIKAEYQYLLGEIDDAFCNSTYFLADAYAQVVSDYGLLSVVAQLVGDGTWGWSGTSYADTVAQMDRAQQIWVFQQFGNEAWKAGHCEPNALGDYYCFYSFNSTYGLQVPSNNAGNYVNWQPVTDCPGSDPKAAWEYLVGTLGVQMDDVFTPLDPVTGLAVSSTVGSHGWNLKVDDCTG